MPTHTVAGNRSRAFVGTYIVTVWWQTSNGDIHELDFETTRLETLADRIQELTGLECCDDNLDWEYNPKH